MIYRFDDVEVEPATFALRKNGATAHMEPKALELLIYLIAQRERVVPKQELLDEVWKGTAVTENALTRAIAQIRKVLGDDLETPRYIQTVPTRGYRFVASLGNRGSGSGAGAGSGSVRKVIALALVVAVTIILASAIRMALQKKLRREKTEVITSGPTIAARPLAPSPQLQSFPTFSPDGLSIAFSADEGGIPHIYRVSVDGGGETQITTGADGQTQPSWSPDGKMIAYVSPRRGGIWIAPLAGGEPQQLVSSGSRPAWSPDGTEIAFQTGEQMDYGWTSFEALPPSTIAIVKVATRQTTALTKEGDPAGGHGAPAWRADGKRLTFSSCDLERCGIFTIARDSSGLQPLITDSRRLASPIFGRDGRAIYYVLGRYNNSLLLSLPINADGARTGNPSRLRDAGIGMTEHLAISRDGFRFAWSLVDESGDLFATPADRNEPVQLTRNPALRTSFPTFSPDGRKIAYCAIAGGPDSGVWIADADGRNSKALAVGPGLKQNTRWSAGEWEVFYNAWTEAGPVVFKASLITGRAERVVLLPRDASAPAVSPDATRVAFNRTIKGEVNTWISSIDGDDQRPLASGRNPVWSRDGDRIALQVRTAGGSSVGVVPASGGEVKMLTAGRGESWPYEWSPDGTRIAFAGRRDGVWNIYTVSSSGGATRRITANESMSTWLRSPAWSPTGDRIAYESGAARGNLWISEPRVAQ